MALRTQRSPFRTESASYAITPPPALDRMASLLQDADLSRVDAGMLADATANILAHSRRIMADQSRAIGSADVEDYVTTATYLACHLVTSEGRDLSDACRLASWRVGKRLGEILARVDTYPLDAQCDDVSDDDDDDQLDIMVSRMPRPDACTRTTQRDRRAEIIDALTDRQREILSVSGSGRWQRGKPSSAAMLAALGESTSGQARTAMATAARDALSTARAGRRYILAREARQAGRVRLGASPQVRALAMAQDRQANPRPIEGHAQVGNRPAPMSGPASPVVIRCMITGDLWGQLPDSGTLVAITEDAASWTLERRYTDVDAAPLRDVVREAEIMSQPCSPRERDARLASMRRDIARAEEFVANVDPARERSTSRSSAIAGVTPGTRWGSDIAASGRPYRKPASSKRKRDGSVGTSMTRG